MVQVKKPQIREAILTAAATIFEREDYHKSTIAKIAREAGVPTSSVYIYFKSKTEIAITVYEPWLKEHLVRLEKDLSRIESPKEQIKTLLTRIWRDLPRERSCIANNIIQAVSTAGTDNGYRPAILEMAIHSLSAMMVRVLPPGVRSDEHCRRLATVVFMAFDGFVINQRLSSLTCDDDTIDLFCNLFFLSATSRQPHMRSLLHASDPS